ncbi:cyclic pyranopterin monophosphate synthase MoaC [Planktothricoides raciborskii]|uniref:Cyclic pyranopterin monophosphate synthase n=2 Tax=Planktothricoides raciborskii TaxID=132608 RepID=A0AAU8JIP5_9CYAN|nr:cyclic pyranopterin monophosphate synthase MoaC [Planktothricoides raciborskii]MBD2543799.1 cyclic pyranopterin monophosphate synthase MoaC [Planktothricoides raciborskii FACHB-1370]MBD2582306.1 cyclic pyranopterin monophosphate synthase MoaC [Planktothricoides raciborskii FACHB-1261]
MSNNSENFFFNSPHEDAETPAVTSDRATQPYSPASNPTTKEASPSQLTHLDASGAAFMVDVSGKAPTERQAIAAGQVRMLPSTFAAIEAGNAPKGDVLGTAKLAGIMAAKQTANLIPLCHPLPLKKIEVQINPDPDLPGYQIRAAVKTKAETGVEMEALTSVTVAALTLYDMAKALDKSMQIEAIRLLSKSGGKSGDYQRMPE